jgi:putative membrane protein
LKGIVAIRTEASVQNIRSDSDVTQPDKVEPRHQWTSEHLANERTHLAWLRTSIALVSFGVTLNRFSLYLTQQNKTPASSSRWALADVAHVGISMVVLGLVLLLYAAFRYEQVGREIERQTYHPHRRAILVITIAIILLAGGSLLFLFRES